MMIEEGGTIGENKKRVMRHQYTSDYCFCKKKVKITFTSGRELTLFQVIKEQTADGCRIYDYVDAADNVQRKIIPLANVEQINERELLDEEGGNDELYKNIF